MSNNGSLRDEENGGQISGNAISRAAITANQGFAGLHARYQVPTTRIAWTLLANANFVALLSLK